MLLSFRWCSHYDMLQRFIENKNFVIENDDFEDWTHVEKIVEALSECKKATIKLQHEKLSLDDFFQAWTVCKQRTKKLEGI